MALTTSPTIADETVTTDVEELYNWLTEKNHPVLQMDPLL